MTREASDDRIEHRKRISQVWLRFKFLQGINIIPGSFMTGQTKWAIYGAVTAIVGLFLMFGGMTRSTTTIE